MPLPGTPQLRRSAEAFYGALADAPAAARRVGWESDVAHALRLATVVEVLAPVAELCSVVDAGCGEGRLLGHLRAAGFAGHYRGEELLPHHVERARRLAAADPAAEFYVADAFAAEGPGPLHEAEVVVCVGTLNTRVDAGGPAPGKPDVAHEIYVKAALDALLARASETLVVSLAVEDRHPPGVGIGRVRVGPILDHLRARRPVVSLLEDGVPGEALFLASRTRRREVARRLGDTADRAELLLLAGDAVGALSALGLAAPDGADEGPPDGRAARRGPREARRAGRGRGATRGGRQAPRRARVAR